MKMSNVKPACTFTDLSPAGSQTQSQFSSNKTRRCVDIAPVESVLAKYDLDKFNSET